MSAEDQATITNSAPGSSQDESVSTVVKNTTDDVKRQAPPPTKASNEKPNKISNMTVETETVDTSSINILPINHDVIPKGTTKKETNIDDSDETFLYDNSAQAQQFGQSQQALPPLPHQVQAQNSANQRVVSGQTTLPPTPTAVLSNPSSINNTNSNNSMINSTIPNSNQAFLNGHTMKNTTTGMRKPRFARRNSSIHSIQQGNPLAVSSIEADISQHGISPINSDIQENGERGGSGHSAAESSTDFTLTNNNNNNTASNTKYSENEDDEDFDSSTYDTRSQYSTTNKSNISPRASKQIPNRRVTSMKLSQPNNWSQNAKSKPYSTLPQTNTDGATAPALRTITSKLFDSKGTQPRRYSGLPPDIDFDDFDDEELDDYGYDFNGHASRLGDDEADGNGEYKSLKYGGGRKSNYGAVGGNEFPGNGGNVNGFNLNRLKKFKRNNDLYYSPHNFPNSKGRWRQISNFCYTFLLIVALLFLGFISGFLLASTKDLQGVKIIDISEVIISQEELVFNIIVDGFNPGFINIEITDVEIEVFAKSSHVHDDLYKISIDEGLYETVLLGSVSELEIPLRFQGGFFTRQKNRAISEIKILNPCANEDPDEPLHSSSTLESVTTTTSSKAPSTTLITTTTTLTKLVEIHDGYEFHLEKNKERPPSEDAEKWHNISQHPFDLIIRGVFKYNLPILNEYKTVGVNKVVMVNPDNLI